MKHLSRIDIEEIAQRYIKAYLELPEVKGTHIYRIDPELFVEKVLGLTIQYEHLSYDGKTLGLTSFEEVAVSVLTEADEEEFVLLDGKTVLIESDLKIDKVTSMPKSQLVEAILAKAGDSGTGNSTNARI